MTKELISALFDGECGRVELRHLLTGTADTPDLMRQWSRMQFVREALSGHPVRSFAQIDPDVFSSGVMARLGAQEPDAPELLSALLDGQCALPEIRSVLDDMADRPQLMQQWSRMCLVRDALAGQAVRKSSQLDPDQFCKGIVRQINAPDSIATAEADPQPSAPARIRPLPGRSRPSRFKTSHGWRRTRPLIGWAAAASFMMVAFVGSRVWLGGSAEEALPVSSATVASNSPTTSLANDIRSGSEAYEGHFGLVPVSAHAYLGGAGESRELHWAAPRFDSDGARSAVGLTPQEEYHLHIIKAGFGDAPEYAQYTHLAGGEMNIAH